MEWCFALAERGIGFLIFTTFEPKATLQAIRYALNKR
jgi:hypothetical protein